MRPEIEEQFQEISDQMIQRAERVRCDFEEFVEGLQLLYQGVQERWHGARDELESMDEEE